MTQTILLPGGYGVVGSAIARHVRRLMPETTIILAGRNPDAGDALAKELGGARTLRLDARAPEEALDEAGSVDAIGVALQDPADRILAYALKRGIGHLSITRSNREMAAVIGLLPHHPPKAPVLPLAHWQAGLMTLAAMDLAASFKRVRRIGLTALFDMADPIGPLTAEDAEGFVGEALQRRGGAWHWIDAAEARETRSLDGADVEVTPLSVLDITSLAAATGADDIRFDLAIATSRGTTAGGAASHDLFIEMEGETADGAGAVRLRTVSDPKGQAHLTGLGAALCLKALLEAKAGLYGPETLLDPGEALAALAEQGVAIEDR